MEKRPTCLGLYEDPFYLPTESRRVAKGWDRVRFARCRIWVAEVIKSELPATWMETTFLLCPFSWVNALFCHGSTTTGAHTRVVWKPLSQLTPFPKVNSVVVTNVVATLPTVKSILPCILSRTTVHFTENQKCIPKLWQYHFTKSCFVNPTDINHLYPIYW